MAGQTGEKKKMELDSYQVVLRPLITEKGTHQSARYNAYAFQVNVLAGKPEVKRAVEDLFDVRVEKVRIQNRPGKPRRVKFRHSNTGAWKKAIVTLHEEDRIDFF